MSERGSVNQAAGRAVTRRVMRQVAGPHAAAGSLLTQKVRVGRLLIWILTAAAVLLFVLPAAIVIGDAADDEPPPPAYVDGIPPTVLLAYGQSAELASTMFPTCQGMRWSVLAGVGMVESGHAAGHAVAANGDITPRILGPVLNGSGAGGSRTIVWDTDDGIWDDDTSYDRAAEPMQFLPGTWRTSGADGNGDGIQDPHNIFDATLAAAAYLCRSEPLGTDLYDEGDLDRALRRYNDSAIYVADVKAWIRTYDSIAAAASFSPIGAGLGQEIVDSARTQLGVPYSWGGGDATGPTLGICCSTGGFSGANTVGFDCSGLTTYAATQVGVRLPRVSRDQYSEGPGSRISRDRGLGVLLPGDLVFFATDLMRPYTVHHVGIYVGGGQMINAPRTGTFVRIEPVWLDSYIGARRIVGTTQR